MSEKTDTDMAQALNMAIEQAEYTRSTRVSIHLTRAKQLRDAVAAHEPRAQPASDEAVIALLKVAVEKMGSVNAVYEKLVSAQPASVADGWVMVPRILAEQVQDSLGRFTGDEGAALNDFHIADAFGACISAAPQPQAKEKNMGPTEESLSLADKIIAEHGLTVDRYELAYTIMAWEQEQEPANDR